MNISNFAEFEQLKKIKYCFYTLVFYVPKYTVAYCYILCKLFITKYVDKVRIFQSNLGVFSFFTSLQINISVFKIPLVQKNLGVILNNLLRTELKLLKIVEVE